MRTLDSLLVEYCKEVADTMYRSDYSRENAIHRMKFNPGISTQGSRHRILWWPRNRRIAKMSRAFHHLDVMQRMCLIVEYGKIVDPDNGQIVIPLDFALDHGFGLRKFNNNVRESKTILSRILKT